MNRFFINKEQVFNDKIEIIGTDVKHIKDVLRLKIEDEIELSCNGILYICQIHNIFKDKIETRIIKEEKGKNEPPIHINLYQGLAKGNKMDLIIQKGTEIGIKEFYPIATSRSVVKIKDMRKEQNKVERWNTIAEEAAKQSKRDCIPSVNNIVSFDDMINILKGQKNIIVPYESEKLNTIKMGISTIDKGVIHVIIGPEGGFEVEEIEALKSIGAKIVTMGSRILRTETAGMVAATIILYELGDLGVI
ncbi:16S rRNA (uracil(1498)-N(3))-methyltransferase [Tissierella sp. MSJ-40]|uniref:Ribosomal RNA small subunit methyltransferase E n=1 Tax=Tissierella simiarum TaxID=2841534 RepID=A0ABS6E5X8_9FIRM|nr:RsmE family RNA methyltransferase [Tissierella simiarum]MBU5438329.1 16S rRNA (uracil(1498)-N(3))-methyltransferase [Tissierella simiarum]